MKLVTYETSGDFQLGVLDENAQYVLNLSRSGLPNDMVTLIEMGPAALEKIKAAVEAAPRSAWLALTEVTLTAPIRRPRRNILCVGKNYHSHAKEFHRSGFDSSAGADEIPALPIIFSKAPTSVIGPNVAIPSYLDDTGTTDYEGELGVIIGKGGRGISKQAAMDHVFGFTIINDVTARQLQRDHKQWFIGKSIDGFCPMGPWLVTRDEITNLPDIELRTFVNDELRQKAKLADLIFDIPTIIETISRRTTLEPGDIIATGTPDGVGIGFTPPRFLKPRDTVRIEIDKLGVLHNVVG
jgi:2-keto-4-pentenoate hydratase/2-oxohepta-3-ene-1,7-dioic acid hydratase in catechol pathway